jgi:hypothetical protein
VFLLPQAQIHARRRALAERLEDALAERVWRIGYTRPAGEFLTEKLLSERSTVCYCPARAIQQIVSRRKVLAARLQPLFARYVFLGFEASASIRHDLQNTPILGLLIRHQEGEGGEDIRIPVTINYEVVRGLMAGEIGGQFDRARNPFAIGDEVDVQLGNGLTLRGLIQRLGRGSRAQIQVQMFGQSRTVKVDLAQLAKAEG